MEELFYYTFPAIRGIQAGMEYYVSMCPLKLIPRIFVFNEEELQPELRAQRVINKARIPEMCTYMVNNTKSYVFSALTASIDGDIEFTPITSELSHYNLGSLKVPMCSKIVINDGQHRRAAIEAALKKKPELGDETISIVFYLDLGLKKSQQMFSDLNRYAIRPTKSLNILYDNRDPFSIMVKEICNEIPVFHGYVEIEKSSISNRSTAIFTLSGIYHGTEELLKGHDSLDIPDMKRLAVEFWTIIGNNIIEWQQVHKREMSSADLRKDYVCGHSLALLALGICGNWLLTEYPDSWKHMLNNIKKINWDKDNPSWDGKVVIGGKISASRNSISEAVEYIKTVLMQTEHEKNNEKVG